MSRVEGKVAIITGAASGLGYAAAIKLMSEGAKVMLSDINEDILMTMPCLLYTSPSPRDISGSRMPSSA